MTLLLFLFALSLQAPQRHDSADHRQDSSAPYQRGTHSLPISVKLLNTGEDEASAKQNAQRIREERFNARSNLFLTGALAVATLLSLIVLGYQSYWLKRSVTQAEKATQIDLRAYITTSEIAVQPPTARVMWTNVGKTPAHDIKTWLHIYHGPRSWWDPSLKGEAKESKLTLAPGGQISLISVIPALIPEDEAQIATGDTAMIYLHGHAAYSDVFGNMRETEYCYNVEVASLPATHLNLTEGYNKAT